MIVKKLTELESQISGIQLRLDRIGNDLNEANAALGAISNLAAEVKRDAIEAATQQNSNAEFRESVVTTLQDILQTASKAFKTAKDLGIIEPTGEISITESNEKTPEPEILPEPERAEPPASEEEPAEVAAETAPTEPAAEVETPFVEEPTVEQDPSEEPKVEETAAEEPLETEKSPEEEIAEEKPVVEETPEDTVEESAADFPEMQPLPEEKPAIEIVEEGPVGDISGDVLDQFFVEEPAGESFDELAQLHALSIPAIAETESLEMPEFDEHTVDLGEAGDDAGEEEFEEDDMDPEAIEEMLKNLSSSIEVAAPSPEPEKE